MSINSACGGGIPRVILPENGDEIMNPIRLVAALVLLTMPQVSNAQAAPEPRTISVTATATVDAVPDMAVLNLGVTHEAKQAGDAMSMVSDSLRAVFARLEEAGIAPRDMQTTGLSLSPVWSNYDGSNGDRRRITGYTASNGVTVRVRDLDALGGLLDTVIADGANRLDGLRFDLQEPDPLMDEARRQAVAQARARAELLAGAAGVTLGPLRSLSEQSDRPRPMQMEMASMSRGSDMPIAGGEIGLSATVSMEWIIAD
jgi:uncharacterized protein YggE